jgi:hypothetical protein
MWCGCVASKLLWASNPHGVTYREESLHVASSFMRCRAASRSVLLLVLGQLCGDISGPYTRALMATRFDMTLQQSTGKDHAAWDWKYHASALPRPEACQPGFCREPDAPPCCIQHLVVWSTVGIS